MARETCLTVGWDGLSAVTYLWSPTHHVTFAVERAACIIVYDGIPSVGPFCWVWPFKLVITRNGGGIYAAVIGTGLVAG